MFPSFLLFKHLHGCMHACVRVTVWKNMLPPARLKGAAAHGARGALVFQPGVLDPLRKAPRVVVVVPGAKAQARRRWKKGLRLMLTSFTRPPAFPGPTHRSNTFRIHRISTIHPPPPAHKHTPLQCFRHFDTLLSGTAAAAHGGLGRGQGLLADRTILHRPHALSRIIHCIPDALLDASAIILMIKINNNLTHRYI